MEKYYTWDESSKKYKGESNAQVDPISSKRAGHTVYFGLPQNGTYEKPLDEKDGFDVVWNGSAWEYQEKKKDDESKPYEPTEEEKQVRVRGIRNYMLDESDKYMVSDFPLTDEERYQMKLYRQYLRDYTKQNNWWESLPDGFADWRANIEKVDKILKESTKPYVEEIEPEK